MAFVFAERTLETATTIGGGPMTLAGTVSGYQSFADGVGQGNQTFYTIYNEGDDSWEVGIGTYISGNLNRDNVLASSSGGIFVNFAAGTKRVFGVVASQFIGETLTQATHNTLNHTGIPGVPLPEAFTASAHALVDHTAPPFDLLDDAAHEVVDHRVAPFNLIGPSEHALVDHTGIGGVNAFDVLAHAATIHSSLPGVPPAEVFTASLHALTDHTGIPGIGGTVPDVATLIESVAVNSNTANLALPAGNWTVIAVGHWLSERWFSFDGSSVMYIDGQVVSTILDPGTSDADGVERYMHIGARSGRSGSTSANFTIPRSNNTEAEAPKMLLFAFKEP